MFYHVLFCWLAVVLTASSRSPLSEEIVGIWKLRSYDAIAKIKASPAYLFADENSQEIINRQFGEMLSRGEYHFLRDTLFYTDFDRAELVYRKALWKVDGDTLEINEVERPFQRAAFIRKLTSDSLVLSPIIDGEVRSSKMIFTRIYE